MKNAVSSHLVWGSCTEKHWKHCMWTWSPMEKLCNRVNSLFPSYFKTLFQSEAKGTFHLSELAGRTIADQSVSKWNRFFQRVFTEKPSPSCIPFRIWLIWLESHYDANGLAGQFWQMESALSAKLLIWKWFFLP